MKRSTILPLILLAYLAVMSYIGFDEFRQGHYLYYFSIIGSTLLVIGLLRLTLLKRERLARERKEREQAEKGADAASNSEE